MGRKTTIEAVVINEIGLDSDLIGIDTHCRQLDQVDYTIRQTNGSSLAGALIIQKKSNLTDWMDLNLGTIALTGASDEITVEVSELNCSLIRPKITISAGSADFIVEVNGKTISA